MVILSQSKTIHTVLVINQVINYNLQKRFGASRIWIGDDETSFSTDLTLSTDLLYDGGFIELNDLAEGNVVTIRRDGWPYDNQDRYYHIHTLKPYQVPNLLQRLEG